METHRSGSTFHFPSICSSGIAQCLILKTRGVKDFTESFRCMNLSDFVAFPPQLPKNHMQAGLICPSLVCCPSATRLHAESIQKCAFAFVYALSYAATLCASVFVSSSRGTAERRWWRVLGTVKPTSSTTIGPWWGSSSTRTSTPSVQVRDVTPPPPCFCSVVVFLWRSQTLVKFSANASTRHSELSNSRSKSAALSNL